MGSTDYIIKNMQNKADIAPTAGLLGRKQPRKSSRDGENTQSNIASYVKQIREVRKTYA